MRLKLTSVIALGILVLALSSSALASSLVANDGFETGDFTGWTRSGDILTTDVNVSGSYGGPAVHSGTYMGVFGAWQSGQTNDLSQDIATTAGNSYTVSFWLFNDTSSTGFPPFGNFFNVSWDGGQLTSMTDANAFTNWTQYSFNVNGGAGTSTSLAFQFYNYAGYYYLDDVSVVDNGPIGAVPEPASLLLMGSGLLGLGGIVRRRLNR